MALVGPDGEETLSVLSSKPHRIVDHAPGLLGSVDFPQKHGCGLAHIGRDGKASATTESFVINVVILQ